MATSTISIEIDADTSRAFSEAPAEERRILLLRLRLRELTTAPVRPLKQIMGEIGSQAEARGLTPEILESLLLSE
jgi:hypothetical protein